jgi:hypothetical protein
MLRGSLKAHRRDREECAAVHPGLVRTLIGESSSERSLAQSNGSHGSRESRSEGRCKMLIILIIVLLLVFGGGGGYYGYNRWGTGGGAGIGLGTILVILLVCYLLGAFR